MTTRLLRRRLLLVRGGETYKVGRLLAYLCIGVYLVVTIVSSSTYAYVISGSLFTFLEFAALFFGVASFVLTLNISLSVVVLYGILCFVGLIVYCTAGTVAFLAIVILTFAAKSLTFKQVANVVRTCVIASAVLIILSALAGIIPNIYRPGMYGVLPYDLGFSYGSYMGYYLEVIIVCTIVIRTSKLPVSTTFFLFLLVIINFICWRFVSQFIVSVLLLLVGASDAIANLFSRISPKKAVFIYPIVGIGYLALNMCYTTSIPIFDKLNAVLSWRLGLGSNALNNYGVSIFGQETTFTGFGSNPGTVIRSTGWGQQVLHFSGTYDYVDSSYVAIPIIMGLIPFIVLLCAYAYLTFLSLQLRYIYLFAVLVLIALQSCINPVLYQLQLNSVILFLFPIIIRASRKVGI